MNTKPQCICLTYIGDNGPCPIHGKPPDAKELKTLRLDLAPRMLKVFTDDQLIQQTAKRHNVKADINPQKGEQP